MMKASQKRTFTICGACGKECLKDFVTMKLAEPRDIWYDEEWQRYHIICGSHNKTNVVENHE